MNKFIISCLAALTVSAVAMADSTDWMVFSVTKGGDIVESVRFKNGGKLTFSDTEMNYSDDETNKGIPYDATHISFSSFKPTWIETIAADETPQEAAWLTYSHNEQQISAVGMEEVAQIRLISLQGTLLRAVSNAKAISTSDLEPQIVIATAVGDGKTVSKKFIIK